MVEALRTHLDGADRGPPWLFRNGSGDMVEEGMASMGLLARGTCSMPSMDENEVRGWGWGRRCEEGWGVGGGGGCQ
jgi:hypothetical protein